MSSPFCKNIPLSRRANHWHTFAHPGPPEGTFRDRHDTLGAGLRWTRLFSRRLGRRVRSSRVVLTPRILASSSWEARFSRATVTTSSPRREDHEVSRNTIAQGLPECSPLHLYVRVHLVACATTHTKPRVQRAPGTPAPSLRRGARKLNSSDANCVARTRTHIHSSSPRRRGSSIPETPVIEPISRGVLDHPPSRVMTITGRADLPSPGRQPAGTARHPSVQT